MTQWKRENGEKVVEAKKVKREREGTGGRSRKKSEKEIIERKGALKERKEGVEDSRRNEANRRGKDSGDTHFEKA